MFQCLQCEHNGYRYEFSTSKENFDCAQKICSSNGGTLARYLDEDAYLKFRKCCQNGSEYWIGLFENHACSSSPIGPYTWVDNATCTNGSPLNVIPLGKSAQSSQAVSILLSSNSLAEPPNANERYDNEKNFYVCQYLLATSTTAASLRTTASTNNTISFYTKADGSLSAESTKTISKSSIMQSQGSTALHLSSSSTSTFTTSTVSDDDLSALIAGLVAGGIILIIALLLLYFFFCKNGYYKNFRNASRHITTSFASNDDKDRKNNEVKENPLNGRYEEALKLYLRISLYDKHCFFAVVFLLRC